MNPLSPVHAVEAAILALLVLSLLLVSWPLVVSQSLTRQHLRALGRDRRRRGYIRFSPRVFVTASPVTVPPRATSTGCKPDGRRPVAADGLALRAALSRTTAPTDFSYATATSRGGHTTDADGASMTACPTSPTSRQK